MRPSIQTFRTLIVAMLLASLFTGPASARIVDGVAIIVNKDAVLVSEINEALMPLMKEYRERYSGDELKKKLDELRKTIIDQAIESKLILQLAKLKGITPNETSIEGRINSVKKRFPSEEDFLAALAAKGTTYKEFYDDAAEQVLLQDTLKLVLGEGVSVTDNEIREYYDSHREDFVTSAKVELAQIFLKIPSKGTPEDVESVRQQAEQLRILIDDGVDFAELARNYSDGPHRSNGGLIGVVGKEEILPELEQTAFELETGEVSPVVQTAYGFHILKAQEAMPSREVSYDEAKPAIEEYLHEQKRNEKYKDWIETLKEQSYIDIKI